MLIFRKSFFSGSAYLVLLFGIVHFSVLSQSTNPAQSNAQKPNILWITTEDMSPDLPMYGDSTVRTPNLSELAIGGIRYTNAYTTAGVCAPSRSALITGMYQTTLGTHNMRTGSGARAGLIDYEAVPPAYAKCFSEYMRANGYYCTNNEKTDYQFGVPFTAWDENSNKAHWRNRPVGKPFFSVFNIMRTHESQIWVHKDKPLRVNPAKIKVPPYYPDNSIVRTDIARYYDNIMVMDSIVGSIIGQLKEDNLLENTIIFFFSDHGAGLPWYKRELYHRGLSVPLIIRFPGKAKAGTVNNDLISFIDIAPTVLSLAGIPVPAHMQGKAFLGAQKAKEPNQYIFAARDRMDELNDMARGVRDKRFTYVRNYQPDKLYYQDLPYRLQMPMMQEILRLRKEGKLDKHSMRWFGTKEPEELYDTKYDPYELNNLAHHPVYKKDLERLRSAENEWTIRAHDKGFIPEKNLIEMMWPDLKQPETAAPEAKVISATNSEKILALSCPSAGASIGYLFDGNTEWQLYNKPIKVEKGKDVMISAIRYGYKQSPKVKVDLE